MDGVEEAQSNETNVEPKAEAEVETKDSKNGESSENPTTDKDTVSKEEAKTEESKEEAPVNSSIHL